MSGEPKPCRHDWSPHYVCRLCGAVRCAAVPYWVVLIVMSGARSRVLVALWTFGDGNTTTPRPIWPSNKAIAERSGGLGKSTLAGHLDWLESAGWITRTGEGKARQIELAWVVPFEREAHQPAGKPDGRKTGRPENRTAGKPGEPAGKPGEPAGKPDPNRPENRTHTFQDLPITLDRPDVARDVGDGVVDMSRVRKRVEREDIERKIIVALHAHDCGVGLAFGPSFVSPARERVEAGAITVEDVAEICEEYARRRKAGDTKQPKWQALFYSTVLPHTLASYLGREPAPKARANRRVAEAALPGVADRWARERAAAPPERALTDEEIAQFDEHIEAFNRPKIPSRRTP